MIRSIVSTTIAILTVIGLGLTLLFTGNTNSVQANADAPVKGGNSHVKTLSGFHIEKIYSVPQSQGSWVSLTVDNKGRLITSDQYGGLFRIKPPALGKPDAKIDVEALKVNIGSAHGLLYAHDSLYVVVGESRKGPGVYRLTDTDKDDHFDKVQVIKKLVGRGEHGPHAVIPGPDGKIYICAGNHTDLPTIDSSTVPKNWKEDFLLGRQWDARGHARGRMAPGGWICRMDPDGRNWELISIGYRNQFDIAFNTDGELFTYDADMEWDIGAPWYRPTRICHVTSGSEFGWRSGTAKWPVWFPDTLPPVVDIGPGSPTGIVFGTGAKFPAKYQKALFICDWSYGKIYAVHMKPDGATYGGEFELFAQGAPLPATDIVVNPKDGAMYFTTGGRRVESALYRITYTGDESTKPVKAEADAGSTARATRRKLEAAHKEDGKAVSTALPYLKDNDRFIRYAARIALEHQDKLKWKKSILAATDARTRIYGIIALARTGTSEDRAEAIAALLKLRADKLSHQDKLALLRAYALVFIRLGVPTDKERQAVLAQLNEEYPAKTEPLNRELCRVLVYLKAPKVVGRTLALLDKAGSQEEQIHYAFCLRNLNEGWTLDQRREYFEWFNKQALAHRGGASFGGFLNNIKAEAEKTLTANEKQKLNKTLSYKPPVVDPGKVNRPFVRKWTVADLLPTLEKGLKGRDFARGQKIFSEAVCFRCHRFAGTGGIVGPDLTGLGGRFSHRDMLEAIIEPSKVISDQYQATVFELANGKTVIGRVANLSGNRIMVMTNMLDPGNFTNIQAGDIDERMPSKTSMMPESLLDSFKKDEILDLLAYLRSGGDRNHEVFK